MKKNYLLLLLLFPVFLWSQGISVSTDAFTTTQLVKDVLFGGSPCVEINNITSSSACGIGYFNANGSNFPFSEGIVIRSGNAENTAGPYTGLNLSTTCSSQNDADLQQLVTSYGFPGTIQDASFIKFDFVAVANQVQFNYIFASQEYGQFQCFSSDAIAFILTNVTTGQSVNMATVWGSNLPVSVYSIRNSAFNAACASANEEYFGSYNEFSTGSNLNMRGQTLPLVATGNTTVGDSYSLKIVVGDYSDPGMDSAILISSGMFTNMYCNEAINMIAFLDGNNNGIIDNGETNFTHGTFTHIINNTSDEISHYSPSGSVFVGVDSATDTYDLNYIIDPIYTPYFTNPTSYNDIVVAQESGVNTYYFPITNTQPYHDVAVSLVSTNQPQPGFDYHQTIIATNDGTTISSGTITFTKDPLLSITAISQDGTLTTETGFTYAYTDLLPNESLTVNITTLMPTIPTVALGDYITNSVNISPINTEINTENNTNTVSEMIVGAYDPNDKMESHGAKILFNSFDDNDYLEYTIRFQNTGNYYATRVRIEDELEAQLDLSTFQMIGASHDYTLTRINNNLVWTFKNIMLPSLEASEEASQGYVRFRIKPNAGFALGDIITNEASIFFDFNPPIITNLFATEFTTTLSTPSFGDNFIVLYPNPAKTTVNISSNSGNIETLKIIDLTGKVIKVIDVYSSTTTIKVSDLSSGIYFLELNNSKKERSIKKLVIN
ncbi:MAG: T9SS type A sorting domain-containing protein [Flavobacterium sp.]|nr:MAG: T9SS type A sorting domain-containing protein [Flavobacterium sp.]